MILLKLLNSLSTGDVERLRSVLDGCDTAEGVMDAEEGDGRTALHFAAYHNKLDCIAAIVEAAERVGALEEVLNAQDELGNVAALHIAVRFSNEETIKASVWAGQPGPRFSELLSLCLPVVVRDQSQCRCPLLAGAAACGCGP